MGGMRSAWKNAIMRIFAVLYLVNNIPSHDQYPEIHVCPVIGFPLAKPPEDRGMETALSRWMGSWTPSGWRGLELNSLAKVIRRYYFEEVSESHWGLKDYFLFNQIVNCLYWEIQRKRKKRKIKLMWSSSIKICVCVYVYTHTYILY